MYPGVTWDYTSSLLSVVEALKVQELVVAVKLATSQTTCQKTESQSQCCILPGLGHLVIVEGTMLLGIRYIMYESLSLTPTCTMNKDNVFLATMNSLSGNMNSLSCSFGSTPVQSLDLYQGAPGSTPFQYC